MRNLITGLCLSGAAISAFGAGAYDGIYQSSASSTQYVSLHQNGSTLIAAVYDSTSNGGVRVSILGGSIVPAKLDFWNVYSGTIVNNAVILTGQIAFGGCTETVIGNFQANGSVTVTFNGAVPTLAGLNAGLNCNSGTPVGTVLTFNRVF